MGIAEEIKQPQFKNHHQKAMINLFYTSNWLSEKIRHILATENLTHQQFNVLRILRGSHPRPMSNCEIRERMLDRMSDTSRIVNRLVEKEMATRIPHKADKRLVDIQITEIGIATLKRMDQKESLMFSHLRNITDSEARQLSDLLDKLRNDTGNFAPDET